MKAVLPSQVSMPPTMVGLTVVCRFLLRPPTPESRLTLPLGMDIFLFAMYDAG